ncbi:MAG: RNA polymerase sigma factor [Myxococcota bacterium]
MSSDFDLLSAWRAGDNKAAAALLERHFAFVHRYLWRRIPEEAEDLAQKTFLACLEHRDRLANAASFRGFVFGIARNTLRNAAREHRRRARSPTMAAQSEYSPSAVVAQAEEQRLLVDAMGQLPRDEQLVLELHYWESMTTREIAELLDVPQGTIKTRMRSGRVRLRALIEAAPAPGPLIERTLSGLDDFAKALADIGPDDDASSDRPS